MVGGTLCALALIAGFSPKLVVALAHDGIVMRALGLTLGFAAFMLASVAIKAAAGTRRLAAMVLATPIFALGGVLLVYPAVATYLYDTERGIFVPWVFGVPAVLALMLSRWRL